MRPWRIPVISLITIFAFASPAIAAGAPAASSDHVILDKSKTPSNKSLYEVNVAVPAAAALGVIGVKDVDEIGADIAPDLYYSAAPKDKGVPELAVSVRPYWVMFNPSKTVQDYQDDSKTSAAERIFARTRLSLATANNADGKGFAVGMGLNTMLTGRSDPRSDRLFLSCVQDAYQPTVYQAAIGAAVTPAALDDAKKLFSAKYPISGHGQASDDMAMGRFKTPKTQFEVEMAFGYALADIGITDPDQSAALYDEWLARTGAQGAGSDFAIDRTGYDDCVKKATTRYQARPAWALGVGAAYRGSEQKFEALKYAGVTVWTTYRIPLFGVSAGEKAAIAQAEAAHTDKGQNPAEAVNWKGALVFSGRYVSNDKVEQAGKLEAASTGLLAAQFKAARGPLELFATAAYIDRDFDSVTLKDDAFTRYALGVKTPIAKGLSLDLSGGSTSGRVHKEDSFFIFRITATDAAFDQLGKFSGFLENF